MNKIECFCRRTLVRKFALLEIKYLDKGIVMELILQPTTTSDSYKTIRSYLDSMGDKYEIPDKNNLQKVVLGIISVSEKAKIFNGIEPSISFKNKTWCFGLYLDNEYICKGLSSNELDKYIKQSICERMEELKECKTLRGIKDRTMFEDIIKLFT